MSDSLGSIYFGKLSSVLLFRLDHKTNQITLLLRLLSFKTIYLTASQLS
jgi:hypothetical protein